MSYSKRQSVEAAKSSGLVECWALSCTRRRPLGGRWIGDTNTNPTSNCPEHAEIQGKAYLEGNPKHNRKRSIAYLYTDRKNNFIRRAIRRILGLPSTHDNKQKVRELCEMFGWTTPLRGL